MTAQAIDDEFLSLTEQYRREILAHCYRMTGSIHDAEDLVQETYLRGWKAYDRFEGKSSLRTWLYRIATNTCLTALEGKQRRPLPTGLGAPSADPLAELDERTEIPWLEPLPDDATDPASIVGSRESVRLAFVAALQHLPAKQRAVLVLREVLQWKAQEVAEAIGSTTAAVNSLLQRARAQLQEVSPTEENLLEPEDPMLREQLRQYISAFERYDVDAIAKMFTTEAIWEMPPFTGWYRGGPSIAALIKEQCPAERAGDMRLLETSANGQPAIGLYMREGDGVHRPFQMHVLDVTPDGVAHVVCFFDLSLFEKFGLPSELPETLSD